MAARQRRGRGAELGPPELLDDAGHLVRVARQAHVAFAQYSTRSGVPPVQYAILLAVVSAPGIDQKTVCDLASLDRSTVADSVRRLVRDGLLSKERHPDDRRRNVLLPTAEGTRRVRREMPRLRQADDVFLSVLAVQRRARLIRQMHTIAFAHRVDPRTVELERPPVGDVTIAETTRAFGRLVRVCNQAYEAHWSAIVGRTITPVQYALLHVSCKYGALDQRTLGELASVDKSTSAPVVQRLTSKGLLQVGADVDDGRRKLIEPTARGRMKLRAIAADVRSTHEALLEPLVEKERLGFITALRQVVSSYALRPVLL